MCPNGTNIQDVSDKRTSHMEEPWKELRVFE